LSCRISYRSGYDEKDSIAVFWELHHPKKTGVPCYPFLHPCLREAEPLHRNGSAASLMDIPLLSLASNAAPPCLATAIRFRDICATFAAQNVINLGKEREESKSEG